MSTRQPSTTLGPRLGALAVLAVLAVLATFGLITLGAVVRVTESGLGCPDWPLCHGRVIPPLEFHVLMEYSHRLVASLVSVLVVATGVVAWWRYRGNRWIVAPALAAVALLVAEVALGGVTVLLEVPGTLVAVHLAVSQAILALLLAVLVLGRPARQTGPGRNSADDPKGAGRRLWWLVAAVGGVYAVTITGSFVVGANATFACGSWPLCDGGLLPQGWLGWVHMGHRVAAALVGGVVLWAALLSWRARHGRPFLGRMGAVVALLQVAQVVVGAATVWSGFPAEMRTAHLALATALWGSLVVLMLLAYDERRSARMVSVPGRVSPEGATP